MLPSPSPGSVLGALSASLPIIHKIQSGFKAQVFLGGRDQVKEQIIHGQKTRLLALTLFIFCHVLGPWVPQQFRVTRGL